MPGRAIPKSPVRLQAILRAVDEAAIPALDRREAPLATLEQVQRVHPARYTSRILGDVPAAGLRPGRRRHRPQPAFRRGGAARGRGRLRRGRRGDGGRGRQGLQRHAPARPPCRGHGGHGLLRVQQRRRGRAAGPRGAQAVAARDLRFRRASRQRHPEHVLRRPRHALRLDPPVAALPGHRPRVRARHQGQHPQPARCRRGRAARPGAGWSSATSCRRSTAGGRS